MPLSRPFRLSLVLGVAALAAFGAYAGLTSKAWGRWRAERGARRAEALLKGGAGEAARMGAVEVLRQDPSNARALRTVIATLGPGDAESALLLRARLADLDGSDFDNLSTLAISALMAQRFELANVAIEGLSTDAGRHLEVLELKARLAMVRGQLADAQTQARALLAQVPGNLAARLIVAVCEVVSTKGAVAPEVVRELEALAEKPTVRVEALRALRQAALQGGDRSRAIEIAARLTSEPDAAFQDFLVHAELVIGQEPARFDELLASLTARAGTGGRELGLINLWLVNSGRVDRVLPWLDANTLLEKNSVTAQLIRSEALARARDWEGIIALLKKASWEGRRMENLRQAYLALAWKRLGSDLLGAEAWRSAMTKAIEQPDGVRLLASTVRAWPDWQQEYEELLWNVERRSPFNRLWALSELLEAAAKRRDTAAMLRVNEAMLRARPDLEPLKNNIAYYSLLLGRERLRAQQWAAQLHAAFPQDPVFASTHAFSLLGQKRPEEAMKVIERLSPEGQQSAAVTPCLALVLGSLGKTEKAREVAARIDQATLLPEEVRLLKAAGLL